MFGLRDHWVVCASAVEFASADGGVIVYGSAVLAPAVRGLGAYADTLSLHLYRCSCALHLTFESVKTPHALTIILQCLPEGFISWKLLVPRLAIGHSSESCWVQLASHARRDACYKIWQAS